MHRYVIIMAGGTGVRMGNDVPKQFLLLNGEPVIMHTIRRFLEYDNNIKIVVVLPEGSIDNWQKLCIEYNFTHNHTTTAGGDERFYSVKNGLKMIGPDALIAIHDAVRPLVSVSTIQSCFEKAEEKGNATPYVLTSESVREVENNNEESRPLDRDSLRLIQTPQVFRSDILHRAYDCGFSPHFTDDATVVERLGLKINLVEGNRENIKITTPLDMILAEALIKHIK